MNGQTSGASRCVPDIAVRYEKAIDRLPVRLRPLAPATVADVAWTATDVVITLGGGADPGRFRVNRSSGEYSPVVVDEPSEPDPVVLRSPGGRWAVRVDEGDLVGIDLISGEQKRLTSDAVPGRRYALTPHSDSHTLQRRLAGVPHRPHGLWSPDGRRFLTYVVDERGATDVPVVVHTAGSRRHLPWVHTIRMALPDGPPTVAELLVFDLVAGTMVRLDVPPPHMSMSADPEGGWSWGEDSNTIFVGTETPDFARLEVYRVDAGAGSSTLLAVECSDLTLRPDVATRFLPVGLGRELVMHSTRDGWGHAYLVDGRDGSVVRQLTAGEWSLHELIHVDAEHRLLYFTAGGRERDRDPYYTHLYRVPLDGGEPVLITPEDGQHDVWLAPDCAHLIDMVSTHETPPEIRLRRADGTLVATLVTGDDSALRTDGWRPPMRFTAPASDHRTAITGMLFLPDWLDPQDETTWPEGGLPIIDSQYSAPHSLQVPRRFLEQRRNEMALAQLGFAVVIVDGRATPLRRQRDRDRGFGAPQSSPEIVADHIAAMRAIAHRHPFIDIDRAGIYGTSGGGYRAARAMLQFPEFFRVGISGAGSHDGYLHQSLARYYGTPDRFPEGFAVQPNMLLAERLRGHLLLLHGDVDEDVPLSVTLQFAAALVAAGRDFDMFINPGKNHADYWDGYVTRMGWNYFLRHLAGVEPPRETVVPDPW